MPLISSLLTDLAACLKVALEEDGSDDLCFLGVVPGDGIAQNYAIACDTKCGVGWVRMVTAYPAVAPGQQAPRTGGCGTYVGVDLEVGLLRCYSPYADEQGTALDEEGMTKTAQRQADDMQLIRRVINCCEGLGEDFVLGSYTPTPPLGGLAGGAWQVSVAV